MRKKHFNIYPMISIILSLFKIISSQIPSINSFYTKKIPLLPDDTVLEISNLNLSRSSTVVKMGTRLIINLKGEIDSGYGWYYKKPSEECEGKLIPTNLNSFNCGEFVLNTDKDGHLMSDGSYYFIFIPKRIGKTTLDFVYRRPFEILSHKQKQITVSVRIVKDYFSQLDFIQEDGDFKNFFERWNRKRKFGSHNIRKPRKYKKHQYKLLKDKHYKFRDNELF